MPETPQKLHSHGEPKGAQENRSEAPLGATTDATFDAVIVGAGLVGSASALALGKIGLKVALIDAGQSLSFDPVPERVKASDFSARVSAITPANAEFLRSLGVWEKLSSAMVLPYRDMSVWDELGTAKIDFHALEYQRHELGYILENQNLLAALHSEISLLDNIQFIEETKLLACTINEHTRRLSLSDGHDLIAKLVVGADGANSSVRRMLGIETREWDYEQTAIVCTIKSEQSHQFCARQRFSEHGPIAFLPLADTLQDPEQEARFCSLVWSLDHEQALQKLKLSDEAFKQALFAESEGQLGDILDVSERFAFPLRQLHAKTYIKPSALLVGDSAHAIHPLAGQGVNQGFKDVACLLAIVKQACEQEAELNHDVFLRRYQRQRQFDNMRMMGAMEGFKRLFGNADPILRLVRNVGLGAVNKHTFIKRQIVQSAMGLS
jgi:2-polyprenylphenol 6-hydroxylase